MVEMSRDAIQPGGAPTDVEGGESAQQTIDWMLEAADQIAKAEESGGTPPLSVITLQLLGSVIEWLGTRSVLRSRVLPIRRFQGRVLVRRNRARRPWRHSAAWPGWPDQS